MSEVLKVSTVDRILKSSPIGLGPINPEMSLLFNLFVRIFRINLNISLRKSKKPFAIHIWNVKERLRRQ